MPTTGSGTGTQATAPAQGVTAQALIDRAQTALSDEGAAVWPEAEVLEWLNEAVREYSQHLPRVGEVDILAEEGRQTYDLPWDATAVLSVAYPAGQSPPRYLVPLSYRNKRFAWGRCYDYLPRFDQTTLPQLVLGFEPAAGEALRVRYRRPHNFNLEAADEVTVPAEHHHVLVQYVLFAAARRLQQREQATPTAGSSLMMAQLAANARRLELAYLNALNRILHHRSASEVVAWTPAGLERVY